MNENLNLVEILKDCPKGTKLYSPLFGEVELDRVKEHGEYPIRVFLKNGIDVDFTLEGTMCPSYYDGGCVLFPSKEQRDWSKFNVSMYKKEQKSVDKIEPKFKIGDWIITPNNKVLQITSIEEGTWYRFNNVSHYWRICYCDEQCRLWTIQDAKDGDVLAAHECYVVFKEIDGLNIKCYCTYYHLGLNPSFYRDTLQNKDAFHPATKEQRDAMMKAINDAGYEWDEEKKELKLDGSKFDPKTLKPFAKVLARLEDYGIWYCEWFSFIEKDTNLIKCCGAYYKYCIPYNEDTEHLVGTTDNAPEFYRYWED